MPAARVAAPPVPVVNSMCLIPGAVSKMISAIARPSSLLPAVPSCRISTWPGGVLVGPGRSPLNCEPVTPRPARLIELEMTPTFTPAPSGPSVRACGPRWAASPWESVPPVFVPTPCTGITARVDARPATSVSSPIASMPSTIRPGDRALVAVTCMPCARSARSASSSAPVT